MKSDLLKIETTTHDTAYQCVLEGPPRLDVCVLKDYYIQILFHLKRIVLYYTSVVSQCRCTNLQYLKQQLEADSGQFQQTSELKTFTVETLTRQQFWSLYLISSSS